MTAVYAEVDGKPGILNAPDVRLGIAIDLEKRGERILVVPNIPRATERSFPDFLAAFDDRIARARAGKLELEDYAGTTVTLTNPGMIGTSLSVPRLMNGQAAIIGVGSIGTLGKLFHEIIEGIDRGPVEAADAVGGTGIQRLRWGVLPQVTPELASFVLYRFEVNIRASAVMGLVGAGGIGDKLAQSLRFKDWGGAGLGFIVVVVGTIAVDAISTAVRKRIVAGQPADLVEPTSEGAAAIG